MEKKIKHLEFIQNTITRMASNSFFLKGWTVTLIVGLFAFANTQDMDNKYSLLAIIPTIFFWLLDGYYLHQEKLFRKLYDSVRILQEANIDFSMDTSSFKSKIPSWVSVCLSVTLRVFYGSTLIVVLLTSLVLPCIN